MDKAVQTQLANIERRTGKTLAELTAIVRANSSRKHGQIRDLLRQELGMGHGDANTLVHYALASDGASATAGQSTDEVVDSLYAGPKRALRATHEAVMAAIERLGPFETSPKKTYLSLRRKKQFATVGPATNTQVEIGLNARGLAARGRLEALPPGRMCQYRVRLTRPAAVDDELLAWVREAYQQAG
ncbi:MAG TPA: DUF5655 domain-containing protein [Methylomirabilota bacterium]